MVWTKFHGVYFKFQCHNFYFRQGCYIILTILTIFEHRQAQTELDLFQC